MVLLRHAYCLAYNGILVTYHLWTGSVFDKLIGKLVKK